MNPNKKSLLTSIILILIYIVTVKAMLNKSVDRKLNALLDLSGYGSDFYMINEYFSKLGYKAKTTKIKDNIYNVKVYYGPFSVDKIFKWDYSTNKDEENDIKNLIKSYWEKNKNKSEEDRMYEIERMMKNYYPYNGNSMYIDVKKENNKIIVKMPSDLYSGFSKEIERTNFLKSYLYKSVYIFEVD
ncbi:hypothetical protein FDN13_07250 [Caloramator sp. E03]|uniref:hypothetical protein n=1 Tax=Caloramator sp. E03 TaxID=2576307 RepID=UPI001110C1BA|nr:hypothetical protein [Caloramator sp. E03]QCX33519.1 hypothetical protein FDN13_07250 [Caloramator sp. E03]